MVRKDYSGLVLTGLTRRSTILFDCRWWVGQAGREGREAPMSNVWRVRTLMTGGSGAAQVNTMFFDASGGLTAQDAATAASDFWFAIRSNISSQYQMTGDTNVEEIDTITGQAIGATAVSVPSFFGTDSGDPLPWATQGLCQLNSGIFINGRQQKGRIFVPGATEPANALGVPVTGYRTALLGALAPLISGITFKLMVYSRKNHVASQVTGANVWTKWALLKSRRD